MRKGIQQPLQPRAPSQVIWSLQGAVTTARADGDARHPRFEYGALRTGLADAAAPAPPTGQCRAAQLARRLPDPCPQAVRPRPNLLRLRNLALGHGNGGFLPRERYFNVSIGRVGPLVEQL